MKTKITILLLVVLSLTAKSQNMIVVQNATNPSVHENLQSAVDAAENGDYIYIPGGTFRIGTVIIAKQVHIIGAGHYPDSTRATGRTSLHGIIIFNNGSSFSSLEGVFMDNRIQLGENCSKGQMSNIMISRCNVPDILLSYNGMGDCGARNIYIRECIVRNNISGGYTMGHVIENSVIGKLEYLNGNTEIRNCIFTAQGNNYALWEVQPSTFKNCIIAQSGGFIVQGNYNTFQNCTFTGNYPNNQILFDCNVTPVFDSLFVNVPSRVFDYSYDYHLSENSDAKGRGINGTDNGIYGGENPYKEGAVPVNPHIQFKNIPTTTDNQGKLNIQVKVKAQER